MKEIGLGASLLLPWVCQFVTNIGTGNGGGGSNIITPCAPHRISLETNSHIYRPNREKVQNKGMLHLNRLNNVVN